MYNLNYILFYRKEGIFVTLRHLYYPDGLYALATRVSQLNNSEQREK